MIGSWGQILSYIVIDSDGSSFHFSFGLCAHVQWWDKGLGRLFKCSTLELFRKNFSAPFDQRTTLSAVCSCRNKAWAQFSKQIEIAACLSRQIRQKSQTASKQRQIESLSRMAEVQSEIRASFLRKVSDITLRRMTNHRQEHPNSTFQNILLVVKCTKNFMWQMLHLERASWFMDILKLELIYVTAFRQKMFFNNLFDFLKTPSATIFQRNQRTVNNWTRFSTFSEIFRASKLPKRTDDERNPLPWRIAKPIDSNVRQSPTNLFINPPFLNIWKYSGIFSAVFCTFTKTRNTSQWDLANPQVLRRSQETDGLGWEKKRLCFDVSITSGEWHVQKIVKTSSFKANVPSCLSKWISENFFERRYRLR